MSTFAQIRAGIVLAHFTKDCTLAEAKAQFPDIADELHEAPADVQDGMFYDGTYANATPNIPQFVTMRQARLALLQAGLLSAVDAAIEAMPSPQKDAAWIEWEYSQEVHRDKELVTALAPALGLTDAQIDSLFVLASSL